MASNISSKSTSFSFNLHNKLFVKSSLSSPDFLSMPIEAFSAKLVEEAKNQDLDFAIINNLEGLPSKKAYDYELQRGNSKYMGNFIGNQKNGYGTLTANDGLFYCGHYKNNEFSGYGIANLPDKNKYEGWWENNQKHGRGKEIFPNGLIYDGNFEEGKRKGYGELYWPDGSQFKGNFENGRRNGSGEFIFPNGYSKRGTWRNGRVLCWEEKDEENSNE